MPNNPSVLNTRFDEFAPVSREAWQQAARSKPVAHQESKDTIPVISSINTVEDLPAVANETTAFPQDACDYEVVLKPDATTSDVLALMKLGADKVCLPSESVAEYINYLTQHQHPFSGVSWQTNTPSAEVRNVYLDYFRIRQGAYRTQGAVYGQPLVSGNEAAVATAIGQVVQWTQEARDAPTVRTVTVAGDVFHRWGASVTDELAMSLSQWVAYCDVLTDQGWPMSDVMERSEITLATGTGFFQDMAKFRALRSLTRKVGKAYQLPATTTLPTLRAVSGVRNKTLYDPDSNILRNTTEALAAQLGGADTLLLQPHDFLYTTAHSFGERMASNVHHILRHEAHVGRVHDPAAGSYFIENLTQQLVEKSWKVFLQFEKSKGFSALLTDGTLMNRCRTHAKQLQQRAATHQGISVGATRYTNPKEHIADAPRSVAFETFRTAAVFEEVRHRFDVAVAAGKPRPALQFLVQKDNAPSALINQRTHYAKDWLHALGVAYQEQPMATEGDLTIAPSEQTLGVVFCGTDEFYQHTVCPLLADDNKNPMIRWVVGGGAEVTKEIRQSGSNGTIGLKHDATPMIKQLIQAYEA